MNEKVLKIAKKSLYSLIRSAFLIGIIYVILFPIFYALSSSLMTNEQLVDPSITWVPKIITFSNYKTAWELMEYPTRFLFTGGLTLVSTLFQIFSCALAAYGFARFKFKGKTIFFALVILTMIVPPQILVVQQYSLFRNMGLLNSAFTYYFPALFGQGIRSGLMIYIFRQFIKNLPKELEEAANIDGCGTFMTFWRIVAPSVAISFLVVAIFSIVWYWNESLTASMFFDEAPPLSVALSDLHSILTKGSAGIGFDSIRNILMSGVILFLIPPVIVYAFLQKYFIQGIERSGLVG